MLRALPGAAAGSHYCDRVTSSPLPAAVAGAAARPRVPVRRARASGLRRGSEAVLVVGTVLAAAAAFGPPWASRAGVAVAVTAAVLGCVLAWRELFTAERRHARAVLQASQRHGRQLREEREHNASVVGALSQRVQDTTAVVTSQRGTIDGLRHEVFALEGERSQLRSDLQQRDRVVSRLRGTVRALETQVSTLTERLHEATREPATPASVPAPEAEVHHMPRRLRSELELAAARPETLDDRTLETISFAAVLPNYEEDRRRA